MYSASELDKRIRAANRDRPVMLVVAGSDGCGASTVLASVPIPEGKKRVVLDCTDSMAYLDDGPAGEDIYLPRKQRFAMERKVFPEIEDVVRLFERIRQPDCGALAIDGIKVLEGILRIGLQRLARNPRELRALLSSISVDEELPSDEVVQSWADETDKMFTAVAQGIVRSLLLAVRKAGIHFVGATEEINLWENFNRRSGKIVDKSPAMCKKWFLYVDLVIRLERSPNQAEPPDGRLYRFTPKSRIQGLNPVWVMDWEGFTAELEEAGKRMDQIIPVRWRIRDSVISTEPDTSGSGKLSRAENRRILEILYAVGRKQTLTEGRVREILHKHGMNGSDDLNPEFLGDYKAWIAEAADAKTAEATTGEGA